MRKQTEDLISLENAYLITMSHSDVFHDEVTERVESALLFEPQIDSFLFRVVCGVDSDSWKDIYVKLVEDRDYVNRGYDCGIELKRVIENFRHVYRNLTTVH